MIKRKLVFITLDIVLITILFFVINVAWYLNESINLVQQSVTFSAFVTFWVLVSFVAGKYNLKNKKTFNDFVLVIIVSSVTSLVLFIIFQFPHYKDEQMKSLIFNIIVAAFISEVIIGKILYNFPKITRKIFSVNENFMVDTALQKVEKTKKYRQQEKKDKPAIIGEAVYNTLKKIWLIDFPELFNFVDNHISLHTLKKEECFVYKMNDSFNILQAEKESQRLLVNTQKINDIIKPNRFFEQVNQNLMQGGYFVGCVRTNYIRKKHIMGNCPPILNQFRYFMDFMFHRVMPKLTFTKKIYFRITRGKNQAFSKSEALGRLYSCGFEIVAEMYHEENFYFIVKKVKEPVEKNDKNYGLIIRLKRIGQSGKLFNVYKFRTMHPYSEYIQEYIYNNNSLQEGGKFKDDFRITRLGHFMRKFWIDEFPMFINLFKGNMKLVGVRPLSEQYLSLYRKELREKRLKYKPGLFPPFYADLPRTLDEIMDSEMKYLERYEKSPYYTDFIYLFKALYNIFIKKARSK